MRANRILATLIPVLAFTCCSKTPELTYDIELPTSSISLYFLDEYQIDAKCDYPLTYASDNEYNAKVSADGKITAFFVGSTTITVSNERSSKIISVTVQPKYNTYNEPTIPFGITPDELISKAGTPDSRLNEKKYEIVTLQKFLETTKDTWRFVQVSGTILNPTATYPDKIHFTDGGYTTTMSYLLTNDIYNATDAVKKFGIKDGDYITINCTHAPTDPKIIDAASYIEPQNVKEFLTYSKYQPGIVNVALYACTGGKYSSCAMTFNLSKSVELMSFLAERYLPVKQDEENDTYYFVDAIKEPEATKIITLTLEKSHCTIMYLPYEISLKASDFSVKDLVNQQTAILK